MRDCQFKSRIAAGRIISWLNQINTGRKSLGVINLYLLNARDEFNVDYSYKRYTTDMLNLIMLKGIATSANDTISWNDIREQILGIKVIEEDNRSAKEIIDDTFIKHGLKLKKEVVD